MEIGTTQPAHCSVPLSSRLDHLDFIVSLPSSIMTCLEGKGGLGLGGRRKQSSGGGGAMERSLLPPNCDHHSALKDSNSNKGSLFERVASLENRFFQLYLELESSSTSSTSTATGVTTTTVTSGSYASSSQGSKGETSHHSSSFPTFSKPNHLQIGKPDTHQSLACKSQIQRKPEAVEEIVEAPTSSDEPQKVENNNSTNKQKVSKSVKKKVSSKWPHFKLLGC